MLGPINTGIRGFLGYLGLQTLGRNVQQVEETLITTLHYEPFLNQTMTEFDQTVATFTTADSGTMQIATTLVPDPNEMYAVVGVTVSGPVPAGQAFAGFAVVQPGGVAAGVNGTRYQITPYMNSAPVRPTGAQNFWISSWFNLYKPILIAPGMSMGIYCAEFVGAANVQCRMNVRYRKIPTG